MESFVTLSSNESQANGFNYSYSLLFLDPIFHKLFFVYNEPLFVLVRTCRHIIEQHPPTYIYIYIHQYFSSPAIVVIRQWLHAIKTNRVISNYPGQFWIPVFTWKMFPTRRANNLKLAIQRLWQLEEATVQLVMSNNFPLERIHETVSRRFQLQR